MRGWLLANLFIVAIVLIGAGFVYVVGWIYGQIDPQGFDAWILMGLTLVALVGTYYVGSWLHKLVGRWVNREKSSG